MNVSMDTFTLTKSEGHGKPSELDGWLAQVGLARYAPQLKEYGYETMEALLMAEEKDIVEMSEDAGMETPHTRLLVAEWKELVAARTKGQAGSVVVEVSPELEQ